MSEERKKDNGPEQLRAFVERVERIHEEQKVLADDVADIYREAKRTGFNTKVIRAVVRARAQDPAERREQRDLFDTYMRMLGSE